MPTIPNILFVAGSGTPRLVRVLARPSGNIVSSSVANPSNILFTGKHKLTNGQTIRISGHSGSTPSINGDYVVTVVDDLNVTIPVNVTVAGTGGSFEALTQIYESTGTTTFTSTTANESASPTFSAVKVNNRVLSYRVVSGLSLPTWGKVTTKATGTLTVDAWTNGTPTDGQKFFVDGWIADLPRCQEMTETYTPDMLIHSLYNGDQGSRLETKFRGFIYECELDYAKYISSDTLIDLAKVFTLSPLDQLILVPRKDVPGFNFNVVLNAPFSLSRHRNEGYRKPLFAFKAKENVQCYGIQDGYGMNYASTYGTNY